MKLKSMYMSRKEYGKDEGKLTGNVVFDNDNIGEVKLILTEENCRDILDIMKGVLARTAQETCASLHQAIIDSSSNLLEVDK